MRASLQTVIRVSRARPLSQEYSITASRLPGTMRAAHGRAGSVVYRWRKRIMRQTIYERSQLIGPPPTRVLTGNLYRGERIVMGGNVIRFTNIMPYAPYRHNMSGPSKLYGHLLDSFWGSRAMQYSASERKAIYTRAIGESFNGGGGD